jgi:Uncharacterized conserved protein (DUF2190)
MPLARDMGVPTQSLQSLSMTYLSPAPAVAGTLVGWDGLVSTGATPIRGVLIDDAIQNQTVSVGMAGVHEVLSAGAIAIGSLIGVDAFGRGLAVGVGSQTIGRAMSATNTGNQKFQMYITREGTN